MLFRKDCGIPENLKPKSWDKTHHKSQTKNVSYLLIVNLSRMTIYGFQLPQLVESLILE